MTSPPPLARRGRAHWMACSDFRKASRKPDFGQKSSLLTRRVQCKKSWGWLRVSHFLAYLRGLWLTSHFFDLFTHRATSENVDEIRASQIPGHWWDSRGFDGGLWGGQCHTPKSQKVTQKSQNVTQKAPQSHRHVTEESQQVTQKSSQSHKCHSTGTKSLPGTTSTGMRRLKKKKRCTQHMLRNTFGRRGSQTQH